MPRRTAKQAQETREKILTGALNVFCEKGFSRSTLKDIAKHIGMTRGAVYWHFKDKTDLLIELMKDMHEKQVLMMAQKMNEPDSLDELLKYFCTQVDLLEQNQEFHNFVLFLSLQVEWKTEKQIMDALQKGRLQNMLFVLVMKGLQRAYERGEVRPGVDLRQTCDILIGLYTGLVRLNLGGMNKAPLDKSMAQAMRAVLDSIRSDHKPEPSDP